MPVFISKGALSESAYKAKSFCRAIGVPPRKIYTYRISHPGNARRVFMRGGEQVVWAGLQEPCLPANFDEKFHYGGNSLCFMTQIAHLLGAEQIYAIGFTLQNSSPYFFGREHPLRGGPAIYDAEQALHWLSWYESQHPGRLKLLPGFSGPVYDVLRTEELDGYRERVAREGSEPQGADAAARVAGEVHALGGDGLPAA